VNHEAKATLAKVQEELVALCERHNVRIDAFYWCCGGGEVRVSGTGEKLFFESITAEGITGLVGGDDA
jgi:hypothetical protein